MVERDDEHFDLDDDFVAESNEEEQNFDRFIDRRPRPGQECRRKEGQSRLEQT